MCHRIFKIQKVHFAKMLRNIKYTPQKCYRRDTAKSLSEETLCKNINVQNIHSATTKGTVETLKYLQGTEGTLCKNVQSNTHSSYEGIKSNLDRTSILYLLLLYIKLHTTFHSVASLLSHQTLNHLCGGSGENYDFVPTYP